MLVLVLSRSSYRENRALIEQTRDQVDGYELRLDLLTKISIREIEKIRNIVQLPIIFTWKNSLNNTAILRSLAKLQPDFFDFEYTTPISIIKEILSISPTTKIIVSIHDYVQTPPNLTHLLTQVRRVPGHMYKIATFAKNVTDALRMMHFMLEYSHRYRLIGICMGNAGQLTRITAPIIGSKIHYCYAGIKNAPGQFSLDELLGIYSYKRVDRNTQILALLGNPVCHSPSHYTHNWIFSKFNLPALYVKLQIELEELGTVCFFLKKLPFLGCSVTMPFKAAILPFLDHTDELVNLTHSVNTIFIKNDKLFGYNFDAPGALDAIEETISVSNRHIVILGGGNTAKSIAMEAKNRGASVTMLNRSLEKITAFAQALKIRYGILENFEKVATDGYDILCNATCLGMGGKAEAPVLLDKLLPNKYVMDAVFSPGHTFFTLQAAALHCSIIYGKTMFVKQAVYQMRTWFSKNLDWKEVERKLSQHDRLIPKNMITKTKENSRAQG